MGKRMIHLTCLIVATFFVIVLTKNLQNTFAADDYPSKPIEFVVAWPPGGTDTIVRIVVEGANKYLEMEGKEKIYVTNKAGGAGIVGLTYVVRSKPDGYILGSVHGSSTYIAVLFPETTPYTLDDVEPICCFTNPRYNLTVKEDSPFKKYEDLVAYAREHPGKLTCGIAGKTGTDNVYFELLKMKEKIDIRGIPFKGSGPVALGLLGGHVDMAINNNILVLPHIEAGKLRPLLIIHKERLKEFANIPSTMEKGFGELPMVITAVGGPVGIPKDRLKKLGDIFKKAMHDPEVTKRIEKAGEAVYYLDSEELRKLLLEGHSLVLKIKDKLK